MTTDDREYAEHGGEAPSTESTDGPAYASADGTEHEPADGTQYEPEEPDPGGEAETVEFDVTTGEDLVERLPEGDDVPSDVRRTFWSLVLLVDVGLLAAGLGLMLWYFWGWTLRGGGLFLVGSLALADAAIRVRRFQRS